MKNTQTTPVPFNEKSFWSPILSKDEKNLLCCLATLLTLKRKGISLPDDIPYVDLLEHMKQINELKEFYPNCKKGLDSYFYNSTVKNIPFAVGNASVEDIWQSLFLTKYFAKHYAYGDQDTYADNQLVRNWVINNTDKPIGVFGYNAIWNVVTHINQTTNRFGIYCPYLENQDEELRLLELIVGMPNSINQDPDASKIPEFENGVCFSLAGIRKKSPNWKVSYNDNDRHGITVKTNEKNATFKFMPDAYLNLLLTKTKGRAIATCTTDFMFSTKGAALKLKKTMIEQGRLVAVIHNKNYFWGKYNHGILIFDSSENGLKNQSILFVECERNVNDISWVKKLIYSIEHVGLNPVDDIGIRVPYSKIVENNFILDQVRYAHDSTLFESVGKSYVYLDDALWFSRAQAIPKIKAEELPEYREVLEVNVSDIDKYGFLKLPTKKVPISKSYFDSKQGSSQRIDGYHILFSIKGKIGQVTTSYLDKKHGLMFAGQNFVLMGTNDLVPGHCTTLVADYLRSPAIQAEIQKLAAKTKNRCIKIEDLKRLPMPKWTPKDVLRHKELFWMRVWAKERIDELENLIEATKDLDLLHNRKKWKALQEKFIAFSDGVTDRITDYDPDWFLTWNPSPPKEDEDFDEVED